MGADWPGDWETWITIAKIIRRIDPEASIRGGLITEEMMLSLVKENCNPDTLTLMPGGGRMDAGWRANTLPYVFGEMSRMMDNLRGMGYTGDFETWVMSWSQYPPGPSGKGDDWAEVTDPETGHTDYIYYCESEMAQAKTVAQTFVGCAGLGIRAMYCNPYITTSSVGQGLFRNSAPNQITVSMQPKPAYYVLRTVCTVMDGWEPLSFDFDIKSATNVQSFTFGRGGSGLMLACWLPDAVNDGFLLNTADIYIPGVDAKNIKIVDIFNGVEQELNFAAENGGVIIKGVKVRDYPALIIIEK